MRACLLTQADIELLECICGAAVAGSPYNSDEILAQHMAARVVYGAVVGAHKENR